MRLFELDDSERGHVTQSFEEPNIDAGARKLHEWLLSRGFEEGGAGGYAVVYFHPNRPYMIKVAKQPDKNYLAYANFARYYYQTNPLLPAIYDIWSKNDYFLVVGEKLNSARGKVPSPFIELTSYYLFAGVKRLAKDPNHVFSLEDLIRQMPGWRQNLKADRQAWFANNKTNLQAIIKFIANQRAMIDMHIGNIMMRGNEIVFTDPVA